MNVYPCGYLAHAALIERLMQDHPRLIMIDTRLKPWSHLAAWRGQTLQATYGERYRWAGQYLGNVNYKNGGPVRLADLTTGLRGLRHWLQHGYDLLLLCGCAEYARCHRKTIVEALQAELLAIEVVLPEPDASAEQCKCLSIRQPWAWILTHPDVVAACGIEPKTLENRDWSTRYRGPLLLHAGGTLEASFFDRRSGLLLPDYWIWKCGAAGARLAKAMPQHRGAYPTSSLVGLTELVDIVEQSASPWFVGKYGLVLAHARAIAPISYPGSRMLFTVPAALVDARKEEVRS